MRIAARLTNRASSHDVTLDTAGRTQPLAVAARPNGDGSAVNGGEFLMLALATCYCNDLYREAAARGIALTAVEVEASAEFAAAGLAATDIRYRARVESTASAADIEALLRETDQVAEVHNTVRAGRPVRREPWPDAPNVQ
jgi:organic hydroperoxide reductase OsmC/OhrA